MGVRQEEQRKAFAEMGQALAKPEALSQWRRDPKAYHQQRKAAADWRPDWEYDEDLFDSILTEWDQRAENEMQRIFTSLVGAAEMAFRTMLTLSQRTFYLGILIITATFVIEALGLLNMIQLDWQTALAGGGVLGAVGIGSIITIFIRGPGTQIQESIGNLAQVEVAFLSFINQLRRIDWSMATSIDDTAGLVNLVSKLRRDTMKNIQDYVETTEKGEKGELDDVRKRLEELEKKVG